MSVISNNKRLNKSNDTIIAAPVLAFFTVEQYSQHKSEAIKDFLTSTQIMLFRKVASEKGYNGSPFPIFK